MYTFEVWIRLNTYQTTRVRIQAFNGNECRLIAEAQYGQGNVLDYRHV